MLSTRVRSISEEVKIEAEVAAEVAAEVVVEVVDVVDKKEIDVEEI